jgi:hypothetical protein
LLHLNPFLGAISVYGDFKTLVFLTTLLGPRWKAGATDELTDDGSTSVVVRVVVSPTMISAGGVNFSTSLLQTSGFSCLDVAAASWLPCDFFN